MDCSLGPAHAYHLALLATVCNSEWLDLSCNNIRSAIPLIAEAIKYNRAIEILGLHACDLSDRDLLVLGEALQQNDTFEELNISGNPFSSNALTLFLKGFIGTNSTLRTVVLFHSLSDEQRYIVDTINVFRILESAPPLQITDKAFIYLPASVAQHSMDSVPPDIRTRSAFKDSN